MESKGANYTYSEKKQTKQKMYNLQVFLNYFGFNIIDPFFPTNLCQIVNLTFNPTLEFASRTLQVLLQVAQTAFFYWLPEFRLRVHTRLVPRPDLLTLTSPLLATERRNAKSNSTLSWCRAHCGLIIFFLKLPLSVLSLLSAAPRWFGFSEVGQWFWVWVHFHGCRNTFHSKCPQSHFQTLVFLLSLFLPCELLQINNTDPVRHDKLVSSGTLWPIS